jgi:predicted phosphate transport protein (TIGR00153 family)
MNTIKALFIPGTNKFYKLFGQVADTLREMSGIFLQAVHEHDYDKFSAYVDRLEELEHENDHNTHRIFVELGRNFITPFDREDIHGLATALDDIADLIWKITKQMRTYHAIAPDETMQRIAKLHNKFVDLLASSVSELKNKYELTRLGYKCQAMNDILHKCDNLVEAAFSEVFGNDIKTIDSIKKMDQYDFVQTLFDKSSNAVNAIESVIIKYS